MKTTKWSLDKAHSDLGFKIKHLMITNVKGQFQHFDVKIETSGNDFSTANVFVSVEMNSINTNNEQRDQHLRTSDFFEAEKYSQMTFQSTEIKVLDEENFELLGNLTIKDSTKPIKLKIEHSEVITDPYGQSKAGFSFSAKLNRKDWGLNYNTALEAGGVLIGDEVKIEGDLQLIKEAASELTGSASE